MTNPVPPRIAVVAAESEAAQRARDELCERYPCVPPERAEIIIPLGGDGFMLETPSYPPQRVECLSLRYLDELTPNAAVSRAQGH